MDDQEEEVIAKVGLTGIGANLKPRGLQSSQRENAGLFLQKPPRAPQKLLDGAGSGVR